MIKRAIRFSPVHSVISDAIAIERTARNAEIYRSTHSLKERGSMSTDQG